MSPVRVVLYARVSSHDQVQRDLSIPAQLDAGRAHARQNGWIVVREYVDEAESARTDDRPQFQRMIRDARKATNPFDVIMVWKFSRFARNRTDSVTYKALLRKHSVRLVSLCEPVDDSASGRLFEGIIEVIDEFYSANLAEDTVRGMVKNASLGHYNGGTVPSGYRLARDDTDRTRLEPDPAFAPMVQRMARAALSGKGATQIARSLNDDGLRTVSGNRWTKNTVLYILRNEVYTGTLVWRKTSRHARDGKPPKRIRVPDSHPALISHEEWERIQALIDDRRPTVTRPSTHRSGYLLSGLLVCGYCGSPMIGHPAKSGRYHYYGCQKKMKQGASSCPRSKLLGRDKADAAVVRKLRDAILTPTHLTDLARMVNDELTAAAREAVGEVSAVEGQLITARQRLERLYDALESGKIDLDALAPRLVRSRERVTELEEALELHRARAEAAEPLCLDEATVALFVDRLRELLATGSAGARRAFLRAWVRKISANGKKLTIHYAFPRPPEDGHGGVPTIRHPARRRPTHTDDVVVARPWFKPQNGKWEEPRLLTGVLPTAQDGSRSWIRTNDTRINSPML